jgi:para-nitrobenzyl esterase
LFVFAANIGGPLMAMHPIDAIARAQFIVPVIVGANHDESRINVLPGTGFPATLASYQQYLTNSFGTSASSVAAEYPAAMYPDPSYAAGAVSSDSGISMGFGVCPMLVQEANALARVTKVFAYELNDPDAGALGPAPAGFQVGSGHACESKFLYNSTLIFPQTRTPEEQNMTERMLRHWGSFARGTLPTDGALTWPLYNVTQQVLRFQPTGDVTLTMSTLSTEHHCAFWATLGF